MSERQRKVLTTTDSRVQPVTIGRYVLHRQIARGGMATIHIARLLGDEGFSRIVAAKRLHPAFAEDEEFVAMFLDEARIASKVRHRNVVPVLDVITAGDEVILVQEYVHGVPLQWLLRTLHQSKSHVPIQIAVGFACQVLAGLHAAHEAVDELGTPLQIVHRDVSPQNVLIALDGSARLLDFGVAKAIMAAHITREGTYKGKLAYSAPEQLRGAATRQSDVYSLSVMLWELAVGHRMHRTAQNGAELVATIMNGTLPTIVEALEPERASGAIGEAEWGQIQLIDPIVQRGLAFETRERWATALEMEEALAAALRPAAPNVAAAWVRSVGKEFLDARDWLIASEEASWRKGNLEVGRQVSATGPRTSSIRLRARPEAAMGGGDSERGSFGGELERGGHRRFGAFARGVAAATLVAAFAALGNALFLDGAPPSGAAGVGVTAARVVPALPQPALAPAPRAAQAPSPAGNVARDLAPDAVALPAVGAPSLDKSPSSRERNEVSYELELGPPTLESPARPAARSSSSATRARGEGRARSSTSRTPPPVPASPPAAAPASANACNPPYYFEGTKKIFRSACL